MTIDVVKTVKVHAWGKGQGDFVEINECDFVPGKHKKFQNDAPMSPPPPAPVAVVNQSVDNVKIDPEAQALANDAGLDLSSVIGTGRKGKITVKDVENAIEKLTAPAEGE